MRLFQIKLVLDLMNTVHGKYPHPSDHQIHQVQNRLVFPNHLKYSINQ